MRKIELLAPARDAEVAIEAIKCGADAVYMGAECFGARVNAGNAVEDIARVVDFAHKFNARVYVTVNTIIYDHEISAVEELITNLYNIGVDALIVQDMAVLCMNIPPIELHASTQCDTRDASKAKFLQDVGFSQIVVARELSLEEIRKIYQTIDVPIEAFVHGALCVSYSGDCQASCVALRRSANRGECAQMCRLPYSLVDADGKVLLKNKHLLSLKDMNRSEHIEEMIEAGVSSFKIEGRLKGIEYVKNLVSYYRRCIDNVIARYPNRYMRSSFGESKCDFIPSPYKSFNRGFTSYFLNNDTEAMASIDTPKSIGEIVGVVKNCSNGCITATLNVELSNGDGLGYFNQQSEYCGFRLNKIVGERLFPASSVEIKPGTKLYRNRDKAWDDMLSQACVSRSIAISMLLEKSGENVTLTIRDERGCEVTVGISADISEAHTPQEAPRQRALQKVGNTIYRVKEIDDHLGALFIPSSKLSELRRCAIDALDAQWASKCDRPKRRVENVEAKLPQGENLTYHDNVANHLAESFYRRHGATSIERAVETVDLLTKSEITVMTTRYCLRRELGRCRRASTRNEWKEPLYLITANHRFRLEFDCSKCQMRVVYVCG